MNKLRIGFIGTGHFARKAHYTSLARIEQAEVVAICENKHIDRMKEVADQYQIPNRYTDYHEMLSRADIDAVFAIMRPTWGLTQIACDVLEARKHLFIEKPPAMSVNDMERMVKTAQKSGCYTQVGFNRRQMPILIETKNRVAERGLSAICATFYKYEMNNDWSQGSKLLSNGIHAVDSLRWLADSEVKEIVSAASQGFTDHDNVWYAIMRFENGVIGTLLTNYSSGARIHTFELHGKGISAYVDPEGTSVFYTDGDRKNPTTMDAREFAGSEEFIEVMGIRAQDQHFVESILSGKKPAPDFEDSSKTMKLVERIERGDL